MGSMREWLSKVFSSFPSDAISFMGGAVFAAAVNLATAKADPKQLSWIPILLLFISTVGFILLGYVLKSAEESAKGSAEIRLAHVRNNLFCVCLYFFLGLATVIVGLWFL